ncbi:MAG: hypothetical protein JW800_01625 [Candidatus Omnitrophica bacterium]|nr:hypothetical protein [Candidatus Omnitrophota bacterium]
MRINYIFRKIWVCAILIFSITYCTIGSCNNAFHWNKIDGDLAGKEITFIAANPYDPADLLIGTKGFLYRTFDGGANWKNIFSLPGVKKSVNFILMDSKKSGVIYIAAESGVFKSMDNGINWKMVSSDLRETAVYSLLIDAEEHSNIFAAAETGIFLSHDDGENWSRSCNGVSEVRTFSLAQNYTDARLMYAATDVGLYKTEDKAKSWKRILSYHSLQSEDETSEYDEEISPDVKPFVTIDPINPDIVYIVTNRGIFKSGDSGASWNRLSLKGLRSSEINNMAISPLNPDYIFAATAGGVFRFSKKNNSWTELYGGRNTAEAIYLVFDGNYNGLWLVSKKGIYKSESDLYDESENNYSDQKNMILQHFSHEPTYREVQEVAIRYAEVHPQKILGWRRRAYTKALFPELSFGIDHDSSRSLHWDSGLNPDTWVIGPEDEDTGWDINLSWDLGGLIWNDDQTNIDVRSRLMVQLRDDVLDEVTHLYFERRRLQIELAKKPPKDEYELMQKELRLEELTAGIDAMTGGWFSEEIEKRKEQGQVSVQSGDGFVLTGRTVPIGTNDGTAY